MSVEFPSPLETDTDSSTTTPDAVAVRRNGTLAGLLGAVSLGVAILYLSRALGSGSVADWAIFGLLAVVGLAWFVACLDARTPLLVADQQGVRIRLGRSWRGLPWGVVDRVEYAPRGRVTDGRIAIVPVRAGLLLEDLDAWGVRRATLNTKLYGAPAAFSLGAATRVTGCSAEDLPEVLNSLAEDGVDVFEPSAAPSPVVEESPSEDLVDVLAPSADKHAISAAAGLALRAREAANHVRTGAARGISWVAARFQRGDEPELQASPTPDALRESRGAARSEVTIAMALAAVSEVPADDDDDVAPLAPLTRSLDPEDTQSIGAQDQVTEVVTIPVIGPVFVTARRVLGLTVDQVSERTRIRPHVIEAIEADDFSACGGDFYARGHLRTLARILGVEVEPVLATYDERYAHAPIDPRQVFEAELASHAGGIRGTRGGPNWSVLVAAVMAVVLSWSVARLITEAPSVHHSASVTLASDGHAQGKQTKAPAIPIAVSAVKGGAHVVIVDGTGEKVWEGDLAVGQRKAIAVATPIHVTASDGGAVTVNLQGQDKGSLGALGRPGSGTFIAPR